VNESNVVSRRFIAMLDSGYQICFNWSRLKPGFKVSVTRNSKVTDKDDTPPSLFILTPDRTILHP